MVEKMTSEEMRKNVRTLITELAKKKKMSKPMRDSLLAVFDVVMQVLTPAPLPKGAELRQPFSMPSHFDMSGPWSVLNGSADGVQLINLGKLLKECTKIEVTITDEHSKVEFSMGGAMVAFYEGEADEVINDLKAIGCPIAMTVEEAEHLYSDKAKVNPLVRPAQ